MDMANSVATKSRNGMKVTVANRAEVVLRSLPERELAAVQAVMEGLAADGAAARAFTSRHALKPREGARQLYALRGTAALRLIVSKPSEDEIVVEDVVHRELLDEAPLMASGR